jgi:hypothetical protein
VYAPPRALADIADVALQQRGQRLRPQRALEGERVWLHEGSSCELVGDKGSSRRCIVQHYDAEQTRWLVRLEGQACSAVPEASLRLGYCVLPSSVRLRKTFHQVAYENQGACGRGLYAAEHVRTGWPLFEEPPLLIVRHADGGSDECLRAYEQLETSAECERAVGSGGAWAAALAAFDELGTSGREHAPHLSGEEAAVLDRFRTNGFEIDLRLESCGAVDSCRAPSGSWSCAQSVPADSCARSKHSESCGPSVPAASCGAAMPAGSCEVSTPSERPVLSESPVYCGHACGVLEIRAVGATLRRA